jgi:hypothetical protein
MKSMKKKMMFGCAAIGFATLTLLTYAKEHEYEACEKEADKEQSMMMHMEKSHAKRMAKLHEALKLTSSQEPAWKAFSESANQNMEAMKADHQPMLSETEMKKMSAPERLEKHIAMMQKRLTIMQSQLSALKTFYAVLKPEQKAVMDKEAEHMAHFKRHEKHEDKAMRH